MALHLSARMHAFVHGLFRSNEDAQTTTLYDDVSRLQAGVGVHTDLGLNSLAAVIGENLADHFGITLDHPQALLIGRLVRRLLDYEGLFVLPAYDPNRRLTIAQHWELRNELAAQREHLAGFEERCAILEAAVREMLSPLYGACPALLQAPDQGDAIRVPTALVHAIGSLGEVIEGMIGVASDETVVEQKIMPRLRERLQRNLIAASGGNPDDPRGFNRAVKWPSQMNDVSPEQLVSLYVGGTPLAAVFDQTFDFTIPTASRFEHHHIVAGSGHGKTQTLQYLIANDLPAVARGDRSIIVLDSQGDLIDTISGLEAFAPGTALSERIVIIDPTDVEWPVAAPLETHGSRG